MAIEDDVFADASTPEDFDNRWIRKGANSKQFKIREDKEELPVLRKLDNTGRLSSTQMISAQSTLNYLQQSGQRCGYTDSLTCYTFRRGFGNSIEGTILAHACPIYRLICF
jgi:hypothetical protein